MDMGYIVRKCDIPVGWETSHLLTGLGDEAYSHCFHLDEHPNQVHSFVIRIVLVLVVVVVVVVVTIMNAYIPQ